MLALSWLLIAAAVLLVAHGPRSVAAAWGQPHPENITLWHAVGAATRDAGAAGACRVSGEVLARLTHHSSWKSPIVRLYLSKVRRTIRTPEEQRHFDDVSRHFYQSGDDDATFEAEMQVRGAAAPVRVASKPADGHGVAAAEFSVPVPCEAIAAAPAADLLTFKGTLGLQGAVQVVPETGVTVVSDIDDTIKVTEVLNFDRAKRNALVGPYVATPGFVEWYGALDRALSTGGGNVAWQYLSSSPGEFYEPLRAWLPRAGYPRGSLVLRELNPLDPDQAGAGRAHKTAHLARLVRMFPRRKFVLVGDSTETDPEVYGDTYRSASALDVACIYIRIVRGVDPAKEAELNAPARFARAFASIPREKWVTFESPSELKDANVLQGKCK